MDFRILCWRYFSLEGVMVRKLSKHKWKLVCLAAIVLAVVAFFNPEYVEPVARAFMLLIGIL